MKNKKRTAAACALLMAMAAAAMAVQPLGAAAASEDELAAYAQEVIVLVNEERAIYGLAPVKAAPALNAAAQRRAEETVQQFSHTRPDGRASSTVLDDLAVDWRTCGENIAYGYQDTEAVMDGWMHSNGHRANILSTSFEYIGVGVTERGGTLYWTQVFTGGAALETADTPQTDAPAREEAPAAATSQDGANPVPCIGDACPQSICIGGRCFETDGIGCLPAGTCPANLLGAVLSGCTSGSCGTPGLFSVLSGKC